MYECEEGAVEKGDMMVVVRWEMMERTRLLRLGACRNPPLPPPFKCARLLGLAVLAWTTATEAYFIGEWCLSRPSP